MRQNKKLAILSVSMSIFHRNPKQRCVYFCKVHFGPISGILALEKETDFHYNLTHERLSQVLSPIFRGI